VTKTILVKKAIVKSILAGTLLFAPLVTMACDAAGPSTHVGNIKSVDAAGKTFTIIDAQTQSPITFVANNEIINGLKDAKGSVMVNYEEMEDSSKLKALGVTF
jgi:hypothetical protein